MPLTFDFPLIAINVFEDYFPLIASNLLVILFFLFFQNNRKKTDFAPSNNATNWKPTVVDENGNVLVENDLRVNGTIKDSNDEAGTVGQVLSSTATGTDWISFPRRLSTTARDAATWTAGDIIFNTTTNKHQGYDGSSWHDLY